MFASLLLVFACATCPPVPSPEQRSQLGNLGVTAIASVPNVDFHTYARGWISGAAKGGGQGLITGLVDSLIEASRNPPTGPYTEPAMLITVVLLTTTQTLVSGVMGSLEAVPMLAATFAEAVQVLAERITDELFVVTRFPFDSGYWALPGQPEFGACWFRPLHPELTYTSLWDAVRNRQPGVRISYTPVESLQPWLAWEGFPRPRDRQPANDAVLQRISEVTYDLKLWEAIQD